MPHPSTEALGTQGGLAPSTPGPSQALTGLAGRSLHVESSLDASSSGFILTSLAEEISSRRTRWKSPCK